MSSYRTLILLILILLLAGGGLAIWNASRTTEPPKAQQQESQSEQAMVGRNVSFTVTEGEIKKWKLEAVRAVYNKNHSEADLKEVKGTFFNAKGEPVLSFSAPQGHYASRNNAVTLTGGVLAKALHQAKPGAPAGELKAPTMVWDARSNRVTASGGAELNFPQGRSLAQVCRFSLDFSNISLEGGVSSTIRTP